MKRWSNLLVLLTIVGVILEAPLAFAAKSDAHSVNHLESCAVRISNGSLESSEANDNQGFCSGTLIDARTLATSAHCLNDLSLAAVDDATLTQKGGSFYLGLASSNQITKVQVASGPNAAFTPESLHLKKQRQNYMESGNPSFVNQDLVILHLDTHISLPAGAQCPRLPTSADCKAFNAEQAPKMVASYFESRSIRVAGGSNSDRQPVPGSSLYSARSASTSVNAKDQFLRASFVTGDPSQPAKVVHVLKSDSGTGVSWNSGTGDVLFGVQSATLPDDNSQALFAQVCSHIQDARWVDVVGAPASQQSAGTHGVSPPPQAPAKSLK